MELYHKSTGLATVAAHPFLPAVHITIDGAFLPVYTDVQRIRPTGDSQARAVQRVVPGSMAHLEM